MLKGGQNVTCQPFEAISETKASRVYKVTVPSLETMKSGEVLCQSAVTLKITAANKATDAFAVNYGVTDALAPFPLHSCGDHDRDHQQHHHLAEHDGRSSEFRYAWWTLKSLQSTTA